MKGIVFSILIISMLSSGLCGQNSKTPKEETNKKCIVMGVDNNCPIATAMQRFEQKGFVVADNDDYILKGQYLNRNVIVQLTPDKEDKFIGWVGVYVTYINYEYYPSWSI